MDWFGRERSAAEKAARLVQEGVKLAAAGHYDQGLAAFDEVLRAHPAEVKPALRKSVADALYNKSVALSMLGRRDEETTLEELVRRFGDDADPLIQRIVARGLFNLAGSAHRSGEQERADGRLREIVRRFGDSGEGDLATIVCDALSNLCVLLHETERNEELLPIARDLLARLERPPAKALKEPRINALGTGSGALTALGRHDEALTWVNEALRELNEYQGPDRTERIVSLLNNRGTMYLHLDRLVEAAASYDASFQASVGNAEPDVMVYGARALNNKACVQAVLGTPGAELETLSDIVERFAGRPDPRLTRVAVRALVRSRVLLEQAGRAEDARAVEQRLQAFASEMREADDDQLVARVLMAHAHRTERLEDKVQMLDEAVAGLEKHPRSGHDDTTIARAQSSKALELAREGRLGEAIAAWDQALERLSGRQDDDAEEIVATSLLNRAYSLNNLGCIDAALEAFADLVSRFEHRRNARVGGAVIAALDCASQVNRYRQENLAAGAPAVTLPDVLALSRQPIPQADPQAPVPHFVKATLVQQTLAMSLQYATHDFRKHAERETGFAFIASMISRIQQETGHLPSALVVESPMNLGRAAWPDTNYQLAVENMAVLGLPLHAAARFTHAGMCADRADYELKLAGCVLGTAIGSDFELRPGASTRFVPAQGGNS